ncbi:MAG: flagellar export protein FliJ [Rhodobiaceae bacterium]|nr:flagellar export protein FliJ [Rhodobiaceae bacterium]
MKSRDSLLRLKRFQVDEKRRQVSQIESMLADFQRNIDDLDEQIKVEQERAGISDPTHYAYPTFAKAAMTRRDNLKTSMNDLKVQLDHAKADLGEAFEELKKIELLEERNERMMRQQAEKVEQDRNDEAAARVSRA